MRKWAVLEKKHGSAGHFIGRSSIKNLNTQRSSTVNDSTVLENSALFWKCLGMEGGLGLPMPTRSLGLCARFLSAYFIPLGVEKISRWQGNSNTSALPWRQRREWRDIRHQSYYWVQPSSRIYYLIFDQWEFSILANSKFFLRCLKENKNGGVLGLCNLQTSPENQESIVWGVKEQEL